MTKISIFIAPNLKKNYSRTPEIEAVNLSQSYDGLNLSQFQACGLFHIDSSTSIKYI